MDLSLGLKEAAPQRLMALEGSIHPFGAQLFRRATPFLLQGDVEENRDDLSLSIRDS
jgi:hypothetical protein